MPTAPKFNHDCDRCQFLGRIRNCDIYVCKSGDSLDTLIARRGSRGDAYTSSLIRLIERDIKSMPRNYILRVAYEKFKDRI